MNQYSTESSSYKMTLQLLEYAQSSVKCNLIDDSREAFPHGEWCDIIAYERIALYIWSMTQDEDLFHMNQEVFRDCYEPEGEPISFSLFQRYASVARQLCHFQINPARWD